MLSTLKDQLKQMADDPQDAFHAHIRRRVGKKATALLEKRLRHLILLMPGMVSRIYDAWSRIRTPAKSKNLGGFLLSYMYHPQDFLSEKEHGLFGYLDDAYLVALVYERVYKDLNHAGIRLDVSDEKLLENLVSFKKAARIVIAKESTKIENMLQEVERGSSETYYQVFNHKPLAA